MPRSEPIPQAPTLAAGGSDSQHHKMNFVQQTTGAGATDARLVALLRRRLRSAAFVVLVGLCAFWIRGAFIQQPLRILHTATIFAYIGLVVFLSPKRQFTLPQLRAIQFVVCGLILAYFALYVHFLMLQEALKGSTSMTVAAFKSVATYWIVVCGFFGMIIPSTWQRTAAFFGPLSFVVPGVVLFTRTTHPICAEVITVDEWTDSQLILAVSAFCTIYATHIINSLQKVAFEAEEMGQYRLKKQLGEGGMGQVFLAQHRLLARPCAIKLIKADQAGDPTALARFEREVQATAKLTHWNTIDIYDYGIHDDGTFYYVMEYLPGLNLQQLVEQHGTLPAGRAIHLVRQTCHALREAHQQRLLHRDIKTSNIIITTRGGVHDVTKLLDFGLVKSADDTEHLSDGQSGIDAESAEGLRDNAKLSASGALNTSTALTMAGKISGTPQYMSPEQTKGQADERSDIYSLGSVLYFLVTGQVPFPDSSLAKIILNLRTKQPTSPRDINPDIPEDLERVIIKSLAKSPDDRFQSAGEMDDALAACRSASEWSDREALEWWNNAEAMEPTTAVSPETNSETAATIIEGVDQSAVAGADLGATETFEM